MGASMQNASLGLSVPSRLEAASASTMHSGIHSPEGYRSWEEHGQDPELWKSKLPAVQGARE